MCALLAVLWIATRPAPVIDSTASPGPAQSAPGAVSGDEARLASSRVAMPSPIASLQIVDEMSRPVPLAAVLYGSTQSGFVDSSTPGFVGWSDEYGIVRLDMEEIRERSESRSESKELHVSARGFVSRSVALQDLLDGFEEVVLRRGEHHEIRCLRWDGDPLPGVRLWLSRSVVPDLDLEVPPWRVPSPDGLRAAYRAVSDTQGLASIEGLHPSEYNLGASAHGWALLSGSPHAARCRVPGATTLVFGELVGVAYEFEAGEPVSSLAVLSGAYERENYAERAVRSATTELKGAFRSRTYWSWPGSMPLSSQL